MRTGKKSMAMILVLSLVFMTSGFTGRICNGCPECSAKKKTEESCCAKEIEKPDCCPTSEKSKQEKSHTGSCACCFLKAMPFKEKEAVVSVVKLPSDFFTDCITKPVTSHANAFIPSLRSALYYFHYNDDLSNAPPMVPLLI